MSFIFIFIINVQYQHMFTFSLTYKLCVWCILRPCVHYGLRQISLSPKGVPWDMLMTTTSQIGLIAHISKTFFIIGGDHAFVTHWYGQLIISNTCRGPLSVPHALGALLNTQSSHLIPSLNCILVGVTHFSMRTVLLGLVLVIGGERG